MCLPFRLQIKVLADHCRDHLQTKVVVDAQNLECLLELVVTYPGMEGLQVKIQRFMASQWRELYESDLMITLVGDHRFLEIIAQTGANFMTHR